MNIKMSIAIFILLSFLNMGAISSEIINTKDSFGIIEDEITNISEFRENGVKFQYKTKNNIENEVLRTKEYLIKNVSDNYKQVNKNQFEIVSNDFKINAKMWYEDNYTYVEITLINNNAQYTTTDLKRMFRKLENPKLECMQYFLYYEGKVNTNNNNSINKLINESNMKDVNLLDINNGYTGTGILRDGGKINFALVEYNTGSHIIIGTPIIFTTY